MSSALGLNDVLTPGQSLVSPNRAYIATMQGDGNFVVYHVGSNTALWASNTFGQGGIMVIMQGDGNLVIYAANNRPVWASNTSGRGAAFLRMQDDGNLVVYAEGNPTWSSR